MKMRIKQSVCYPMYSRKGDDLGAFCAAIAGVGYAAIEFWGWGEELDEIGVTAGEHGLVVASVIGHASIPNGLNDPANHDRIEGELHASIDKAAELGIPGVICFAGNRRAGQSDEEGLAVCAEGLRQIAPYAEAKGVNLNVELLNSKIDHAGYLCDHTAWGVALCEAVDSPRVKLLYDIYHMQIMEGDVIRTIGEAIRWIGHFHTAGVPGRGDMDDTQELNYVAICRAIAATDYAGYVGHEFRPRGDRLDALAHAFQTCDQA